MKAGEKEPMKNLTVHDTFQWQRTFSLSDVATFTELAGDRGRHHVTPDRQGRIMVHGLLTATVPTKIGGDLNYIARLMTFEFVRPVFVGDTVSVTVTITRVQRVLPGRREISMEMSCCNQYGKEVLKGSSEGIILDDVEQ